MPRKTDKITKGEDFSAVYRRGKRKALCMINVIFGHNNAGLTRLGIVVSAKFSKKAVERNRIKRQIRAILKKKMPKI